MWQCSLEIQCSCGFCFFFFFQAEDGIRDYKVTGVQTCALPISATFSARFERMNCVAEIFTAILTGEYPIRRHNWKCVSQMAAIFIISVMPPTLGSVARTKSMS